MDKKYFFNEIGSEFWKEPNSYIKDNETVYLSGRTALDIIVKDCICEHNIQSALLPSYCCRTMIEPFLSNGVKVRFYDVYVNTKLSADIPAPKENELLYLMKYFGNVRLSYEGEGQNLSGWSVTIEDLTHSIFSSCYETRADYWFTSYRKWFATDGIAIAGKKQGRLHEAEKGTHINYCKLRNQAFLQKDIYMQTGMGSKLDFLKLYSEAEQLLGEDYIGYGASPESINDLYNFYDKLDDIRRTRQENAGVLIEGLADLEDINIPACMNDEKECPLFVPILVDEKRRDDLRKHLISKDIYCPIHWPLSEAHKGISGKAQKIYDTELSLVCDQRYSKADMKRMVKEIKYFWEECK